MEVFGVELSRIETWIEGRRVLMDAWHLLFPLLLLVGLIAWWLRGQLSQAKIDGLKQRLQFARERFNELSERVQQLDREVTRLQRDLSTQRASHSQLVARANSMAASIKDLIVAGDDLGTALGSRASKARKA